MSDIYTQVMRLGTGTDGRDTQLVDDDNPLPVKLVGAAGAGGVGGLTDSQLRAAPVPVSFATAPVGSVAENVAVAVTSERAVLVSANPGRVGLRFCNIGADPVAIGSSGITWARRVIVLGSGDFYCEGDGSGDAPELAWHAICEAGKTASVTVQEVLS